MPRNNPLRRDAIFIKLFLKTSPQDVTEEELAYFREHPDEIDEISAPVNIHKQFLWIGLLVGIGLFAVSKTLAYSGILAGLHEALREFVVDLTIEIGAALIGAAITAYILGIVLNRQQEKAAEWRAEIRRRINLPDHHAE